MRGQTAEHTNSTQRTQALRQASAQYKARRTLGFRRQGCCTDMHAPEWESRKCRRALVIGQNQQPALPHAVTRDRPLLGATVAKALAPGPLVLLACWKTRHGSTSASVTTNHTCSPGKRHRLVLLFTPSWQRRPSGRPRKAHSNSSSYNFTRPNAQACGTAAPAATPPQSPHLLLQLVPDLAALSPNADHRLLDVVQVLVLPPARRKEKASSVSIRGR